MSWRAPWIRRWKRTQFYGLDLEAVNMVLEKENRSSKESANGDK